MRPPKALERPACRGGSSLLNDAVDEVASVRSMHVVVDAEKCQGHNRCYAIAPELFDVDDYGQAVVVGDGTVTAEMEEKARLAVANCPEFAITLVADDGSTVEV